MKRSVAFIAACIAIPAAFSFACGSKKPVVVEPTAESDDAGSDAAVEAEAPAPKSLYERLGKKEGITAVVDSFLKNLKADAVVNKMFAKTTGPKLDHFKQMMVEQLCEATGGDCKYTGKSMKEAHKGMKITEKQWDAVVTDLKLALDENKVGDAEKTDLFALLGPMKDDIVEKKK
jgi:hemoglobin